MSIWSDLGGTAFGISYVDVGPWHTRVLAAGSGEPLVLLHGTGGHLEAFTRNIAALAAKYRVLAYDFPGHGYTSLAREPLEITTYVDHLAALLDHVGIDRAYFSGESLGGWVAVKFAHAHPDQVAGLILNTPGGTMASPEVMERVRSLSQAAADDPSSERIRTRLEWLMADPASVTEELVEVRRAVYSRYEFAESMRQILCLQDPETRLRNMITDKELAAITAPSLVIWTSNDPSGPAQTGRHMAELLPKGRFMFIDGAGHWPQWEQRAIFDETVLDFLSEVDTRILAAQELH